MDIRRTSPLWERIVEIDERLSPNGVVVRPLNENSAVKSFTRLRQQGIKALAIVLMHGFRHPKHEKRLVRLAEEIGFNRVIAGYKAAALIKYIPRAHTRRRRRLFVGGGGGLFRFHSTAV